LAKRSPVAADGSGLRADARRNRARVIAVARAVFSERGPEARMEEIAQRAGVGVGTLYRNFPTKEALLGELIAQSFREIAAAAREAAADPDTWRAFERVMRLFVRMGAADRALARATPIGQAEGPLAEARDELHRRFCELIERAQAAGTLRPDVAEEDLLTLFGGIIHAPPHRRSPEGQERCVAIVLDGLRSRSAARPG
jgi:AcrR family transcriptional regulator